MGNLISRFAGVAAVSTELWLYLWPVSLVLFVTALGCVVVLYRKRRLAARPTLSLFAVSAVSFVGVAIYTVVFWADPRTASDSTQRLPLNGLNILMSGYLVAVAVTVVLASGYRWLLAGVAAGLMWLNCGLFMVARMAVSGVWL